MDTAPILVRALVAPRRPVDPLLEQPVEHLPCDRCVARQQGAPFVDSAAQLAHAPRGVERGEVVSRDERVEFVLKMCAPVLAGLQRQRDCGDVGAHDV